MSEADDRPTNGWTFHTIYVYFISILKERDDRYEARWKAQEEATKQAFDAADKAVTKAEVVTSKRLDTMNEFRGALEDAHQTYLTIANYDLRHEELMRRIEIVDTRITALDRWRGQLDALRGSREESLTQKWLPAIALGISLLTGIGIIVVAVVLH